MIVGRLSPTRAADATASCSTLAQAAVDDFDKAISEPCADLTNQTLCVHAIHEHADAFRSAHARMPDACLDCPRHTIVLGYDNERDQQGLFSTVCSFMATQHPQRAVLNIWTRSNERQTLQAALDTSVARCSFTSAGRLVVHDERELHALANANASTAGADMLRVHILAQRGGIYTDSDMLFLKDMQPFCHAAFAYRWSFLGFHNNAVLGCAQNCSFARRMISALPDESDPRWDIMEHPARLLFRQFGLRMLPSRLFDPSWLAHDRRDFSGTGDAGAWLHHWHGGLKSADLLTNTFHMGCGTRCRQVIAKMEK